MGALILTFLAFVGPALPQQTLPGGRVQPIVGPVRDAGILHVATNTWTRNASTAHIGADVIYDNTATHAVFFVLGGDTLIDEGRLPSPSSPTSDVSRPGCATQYTIDGVQIGYCTDIPSPMEFDVAFYESYTFCTTVVGVTPTGSLHLAGLPGGAVGSPATCWIVTVDLDVPGSQFVMRADGDGTYTGMSHDNLFGWSIRQPSLPPASQLMTGPIVAGDPLFVPGFHGTRWDSPVNYLEAGTGMGTIHGARRESGPQQPNCYFFGSGDTFTSLHLELYADTCDQLLATTFCFGDGTGTPCPCGNTSPVPGTGCLNSLGVGGRIGGTGVSSLAADTAVLLGDQMPPNAPTLYFQGTLQQSGGAGATFGDGKRCAGGSVIRLATMSNSPAGASSYPRPGDPPVSVRGQILVPGSRTYQAWYRNAASFCTPSTFNLTNGIQVTWTP